MRDSWQLCTHACRPWPSTQQRCGGHDGHLSVHTRSPKHRRALGTVALEAEESSSVVIISIVVAGAVQWRFPICAPHNESPRCSGNRLQLHLYMRRVLTIAVSHRIVRLQPPFFLAWSGSCGKNRVAKTAIPIHPRHPSCRPCPSWNLSTTTTTPGARRR